MLIAMVARALTNLGRFNLPKYICLQVIVPSKSALQRTSEYVFPSPKTEGRLIDIKSSFDKAKREAGIRDFRFHDLRLQYGGRRRRRIRVG